MAVIIDTETNNKLGEISLVGTPEPVSDWINSSGPLQKFIILDGMDDLRKVWLHQEEVLLLTKFGQRSIKIITYPTEGENQGYLDFTSELKPHDQVNTVKKLSLQRGLAFLQSILGT